MTQLNGQEQFTPYVQDTNKQPQRELKIKTGNNQLFVNGENYNPNNDSP